MTRFSFVGFFEANYIMSSITLFSRCRMFKRCSPSNRKPLQMVRYLPGNLPGRGRCGQVSVNPPDSSSIVRRALSIGVCVRLEHVCCGVEV